MSNEGERLQLGRDKRRRPSDSGNAPDSPDDAGALARFRHRRRQRRAATKARVAAMSGRRRFARRSMIVGTWLLGFLAAGMVAVIVMYYMFTDVPRPETLPVVQVATIEYSDGSTLARIGTEDRTIVHLEQVPQHVRWAVLAAEDRGFYSEPGVSIRGTVRAALTDVTGGNTQGGSGITQQYVKNAYLNNATSLTRKLKELMIAVKLTRNYSKDQILEFYLNTVYFGRGAYGIQAAAHAFFNEDVGKLTVAQGALLAGLLRAPSYYDPANDQTVAQQRWRYVIDGMVKTKHLTQAQELALKFPTTIPPRGNGLGSSGWRSLLVNRVLAELQAHGISEAQVNKRGLTIRTTIDKKAQKAALTAITATFAHLTKKQRNLKNALTAVDPKTGAVLAYYGGSGPGKKGYDGKVDYNDYAGRGGRPPGSSFKPYTLATVLTQTVKKQEGKQHLAIDSIVDGSYKKKIDGTLIQNDPGDESVSSPQIKLALAMKYSLNTTFDQLAFQAGPDNVADTAHAMGIAEKNSNGTKTLQDRNGHTTFGIGIGDYAVTPLDQAVGFATLDNGGKRNEPYFVQKATASDGEVVYTHHGSANQAIDKRVANDTTLTLEPIAAWSDDPLANGRPSAAKTGTEGITKKGSFDNSDAWMVGFTPQVSASVWVGTGLSKPIFNAAGQPLYGADLPGKTWKLFMDTYLAGKPALKLPSKQLIAANGGKPKPSPTFTPKPTQSKTPKPTFSITSGFPSPTAAPSTSTPYSPPPVPSGSNSATPSCGGLLGKPCKSTPAASAGP
jgi:membrane peptidoglycan carboxypeptidase